MSVLNSKKNDVQRAGSLIRAIYSWIFTRFQALDGTVCPVCLLSMHNDLE
jgi:hypothetical protein